MIRETIRICSDPNIDNDKNIDLQKKATDGTQASNPNKRETNNADSQHKGQSQQWRKEERESTLNKIGKRGNQHQPASRCNRQEVKRPYLPKGQN